MYYTLTYSQVSVIAQTALLAESFYIVLPVLAQAVMFKGGWKSLVQKWFLAVSCALS